MRLPATGCAHRRRVALSARKFERNSPSTLAPMGSPALMAFAFSCLPGACLQVRVTGRLRRVEAHQTVRPSDQPWFFRDRRPGRRAAGRWGGASSHPACAPTSSSTGTSLAARADRLWVVTASSPRSRRGIMRERIQLQRVLADGQLLLVGRAGDRTVDLGEAPAALGVPRPDLRRRVLQLPRAWMTPADKRCTEALAPAAWRTTRIHV